MNRNVMQSLNFEFLRPLWPDLAALGGFAEQYSQTDPASSLVKLRSYVESMVQGIYRQQGIQLPAVSNLNDLLRAPVFTEAVPRAVCLKMNAIRDHGNKAAHGEEISQNTALWLLKESFDLGQWFFLTYLGGKASDCPPYQEPPAGGIGAETKARLKEEKKIALSKLATQEAQLATLMAELSELRTQAAAAVAEPERMALVQGGQAVADELKFSEAATRKWLIDSQLVAAGWKVSAEGLATEEVTQEEEVQHQPTKTGLGYADYVLWDDNGKPLAVVEAKKTAESAEKGQTQARLYADGLEKKHGQRPVIFYTNGFDIWIWDDAQNYPPRQLFGFYSKDSLQYLVHQRVGKQALEGFSAKPEIINRLYQYEAVKRVCERFTTKRRKALIVQATGTGKTRVAIALTELLIRAGWAKRVLFLCDRRELRKQAKNAFNDFLNEPLVVVGSRTAKDRNQRIYLATYPAMSKVFQSFDPGFFDLIIADESHRSIYNVHGDLFRYFDCLQVGLTATPVEFVTRNTFQLFECDTQNPTFNYEYNRAVEEGYLVPFEVFSYQTFFLKRGIKFEELTDEQREELTDQGEDPQLFDYEPAEIDKNIFNKDTARHILRNLMENGIKDATGQSLGKSIIFARNHEHAVQLRKVFDELYPQYGGKFCQVIDNYDPRAEQLIDDFKTPANDLTIAISVDMLDTGIDVPEVVNLVFAKPVFSKVKFWQMIGRGTRLCRNLFGEGKDKQVFAIFDHWANFDYFDFHYKPAEPTVSKPLMQQVFEARVDLADAALQAAEPEVFQSAVELIGADLNSLPEASISVREKWRQKRAVSKPEVLHQFDPATVAVLRTEMAPLMQWVNIRGHAEAHDLDLLIARMQIDLLRKTGRFDDYKITLMDRVNCLQMHLNPVREKTETIKQLRSKAFWSGVTPLQLESVRQELREIIHHVAAGGGGMQKAKVVDVADVLFSTEKRPSAIPAVDMRVYRQEVEKVLLGHFDKEPVLQKIRRAEPVTEAELKQLVSLVLTQHPDVNLEVLAEFYESALPLDFILRSVVGLEPEVVKERFAAFVQKHPHLTAKQTRFLALLQNHIARYGSVEIERLYEDPFTVVDVNGLDGVFGDDDAEEVVHIISTFAPINEQELPT